LRGRTALNLPRDQEKHGAPLKKILAIGNNLIYIHGKEGQSRRNQGKGSNEKRGGGSHLATTHGTRPSSGFSCKTSLTAIGTGGEGWQESCNGGGRGKRKVRGGFGAGGKVCLGDGSKDGISGAK